MAKEYCITAIITKPSTTIHMSCGDIANPAMRFRAYGTAADSAEARIPISAALRSAE